MTSIQDRASIKSVARIFLGGLVLLVLWMLLSGAVVTAGDVSGKLQLTRKEGAIQVSCVVPEDTQKLIFEYRSGRNRCVSKMSDVAGAEPRKPGSKMKGKEMWFPVVDVALTDRMQGIAAFDHVQPTDRYCLNGNFGSDCHPLQGEIVFTAHLEHWENHLYVESQAAELTGFYLRETVNISGSQKANRTYIHVLKTLTPDWFGSIRVLKQTQNGKERIGEIDIPEQKRALDTVQNQDISRAGLINALKSTVRYILANQNKNPLSPTHGGVFLFYDLDAKTYRRSDWIWTYGPAIKLLLQAAEIPELAEEFGAENLLNAAKRIGEASLRFQMLEKDHSAYGLVICRYDPWLNYPEGFTGYLSPADSLFLAGWGWIPLYEATGDKRFLDAAVLMVEQVERILSYDEIIEQDFILKAGKWKNWTMDESGFGMQGIAEVYKITRSDRHKKIGRSYIEGLIGKLERPDGVWYHNWHRNQGDRADDGWKVNAPKGTPVLIKQNQTARGNGWAMIGLLASHRMMPEKGVYLAKAKRLAEHVMKLQRDDGSWSFYLYRQTDREEISEKGTALWCMLFYQLHEFTHDAKHLDAARKALVWCMKNQYSGTDSLAYGGIVGRTRASGVVYREWYPLICTYTMDFFGLALIEQIQLLESCNVAAGGKNADPAHPCD